jgi:hypothetical protein
MLVTAQEKRMVAQNIITQSYGELLQLMTANAGGDFVQMVAPLPALTAANNSLIQSCMITAKWDQAMRANASAEATALWEKYCPWSETNGGYIAWSKR